MVFVVLLRYVKRSLTRLLPLRYDGMMANGAKLEKAIIQVAEKVQLPQSPGKDV